MFSVYGSSGRLFRGTLEQLRQIGPVHAVDRTRTIEPVARDGRDSALREAVEHETGAVREPLRSALAAYVSQSPAAAQRWAAAAVESVMSHDVLSVTNTSTIAQAWQLLEFHGFGQAPVVDADAALVGLVTYSHLLRFSQLPGPDSKLQDWLDPRAQRGRRRAAALCRVRAAGVRPARPAGGERRWPCHRVSVPVRHSACRAA